MTDAPRPRDPLHGVTLERLLTELVGHYGWSELGRRVPVRCFQFDPSVKSSLTFLRRTPWARTKVESLYVDWKKSAIPATVPPAMTEDPRPSEPAPANPPAVPPPAADADITPRPAGELTPEEQMERFARELKETDWGHQPC